MNPEKIKRCTPAETQNEEAAGRRPGEALNTRTSALQIALTGGHRNAAPGISARIRILTADQIEDLFIGRNIGHRMTVMHVPQHAGSVDQHLRGHPAQFENLHLLAVQLRTV